MQYITYYRTSTRKQDLGIEAQKSMVSNYLKPSDSVIASYQEQETGTSKKMREELTKALDHCRESGSVLLIAKLDRLARSVYFISNLMESGVEFKALDLPQANKMTIHIFAALAEHEAELISQRTKAALGELKKKGVQLGNSKNFTNEGRAKGAKLRSKKAKNSPRRRQCKAYAEVLREQGYNFTKIAEKMNQNGYTTSKGKQYHPVQVQRLLN